MCSFNFNQEKALVGAFSVIAKSSFEALGMEEEDTSRNRTPDWTSDALWAEHFIKVVQSEGTWLTFSTSYLPSHLDR